MLVKDLIELLNAADPDLTVVISADHGQNPEDAHYAGEERVIEDFWLHPEDYEEYPEAEKVFLLSS